MNAQPLRRPTARRRGYGLSEVVMAVILLMAAMTLMVKAVALVGVQRREADRRLWAVESAANVMERLTSEPFERVTADRARTIAADCRAEQTLPGASWGVEVADDAKSPVPAKRVSLRLSWKDRSGNATGPVGLTAWVYKGRGRS